MPSIKKFIIALIIFILSGCGGTPAPANKEVFNQINKEAGAIIVKENYQTPLKPDKYIEVMNKAFEKVGYSYSATLQQIASEGISAADPEKYGFAMFLVLSILNNQENVGADKYYSGQDLEAVKEIIRMMENPHGLPS